MASATLGVFSLNNIGLPEVLLVLVLVGILVVSIAMRAGKARRKSGPD